MWHRQRTGPAAGGPLDQSPGGSAALLEALRLDPTLQTAETQMAAVWAKPMHQADSSLLAESTADAA